MTGGQAPIGGGRRGGSASQVERLLALVPYLQANPGVRVEKVSEQFAISQDQLRADLDLLWMCGLPGLLPGDLIEIDMEALEDGGVIHLSNAEYLARPLRLTQQEVVPLVLGLRTLAEVQDNPAVTSALGKLEALGGAETVTDRVRVRVSGGADEVRRALAEAIDTGRRLRLVHDSSSRFETTIRVVDPVSVEIRDGYAYLEAWNVTTERPGGDQDSGARPGWRSFRVDRIAEAAVLEQESEQHGVPPDHAVGWLDQAGESAEVTITVRRGSAWIAEYYPVVAVRTRARGRVEVTIKVVSSAFLRGLLLRLGTDLVAVAPEPAAQDAARAATEALEQYEAWSAAR